MGKMLFLLNLKIEIADKFNTSPRPISYGMEKTKEFIKEVYAESKNITWPTRKQTIFFTVAVVIISLLVAYFLGALDVGFSQVLNWLLRIY